jgi:hypothetical protein
MSFDSFICQDVYECSMIRKAVFLFKFCAWNLHHILAYGRWAVQLKCNCRALQFRKFENRIKLTKIILGADHLTFEGRVFWKKISWKAILNKKNTCINKLWEKYPAPVFGGKKCCKTAWLQGLIWPVPEDQLVWFSGTSVRLISCWKTPQNAGNSLSELQEIPRPL